MGGPEAILIEAGVLLCAYLVGSIPFSYLVGRQSGIDVRRVGSGNVGATNVMRSAGRAAGLVAFGLDFAKGVAATGVAVYLAGRQLVDVEGPALAAMAAVVGHMHPVWLSFRGGKGVATGAGAFLPLVPVPTGLALVIFALVTSLTGYVSLGSVAGTVSLAVLAFVLGASRVVVWSAAATAALITWKHRGNLRRILAGTERRLSSVGPPSDP